MRIDHFDLAMIAGSGQCFRWKEEYKDENKTVYSFITSGRKYTLCQTGDEIDIDCSLKEFDEKLREYFDFSTDYSYIEKLIYKSKDEHLKKCFENGRGIRILKQDLWEIIISFLISQNNNIPRIKGSIEKICAKAGILCENSDSDYAFPTAEKLNPDFFDDSTLGLGYRVPFLQEMVLYVQNNPGWLDYLLTLNYEQARAELLKRKGIGPKVADCICLFGLHHIDAFPIDTHVKQLLNKYYADGFDYKYFEGYAGVIQQYLFFYELS